MSSASMKSLSEAVGFHQCGDLHQAETMYRQIIEAEPYQTDALNLLGVLCGQTGRLDEAAELLTQAVQSDPLTASIRYNLANVMRELDRPDDAIEAYQHAIELDAEHVSSIHNLGATLLEVDRPVEAIPCFERTLQLYQQHPTAYENLLQALQAAATPAAADRLRDLLASRPDDAGVLHALGVVLSAHDEHTDAAACWQQAAVIEPTCADHWHNRGHALQCAGEYDTAIESYQHAVSMNANVMVTWSGLITCQRRAARLDDALDSCRRALTPFPHSPLIRDALLFVLADLNHHEHAIELCMMALEKDPDDAGACQMAAGLLNAAGRRLEARGLLERLVDLRPDDPDALTLLATAHIATGDVAAARGLLARAIAVAPDHVEAHVASADAHRSCGGYEEASAIIQGLCAAHPTDLNVLLGDVTDARREGRQQALVERLSSVLREDGAAGGTEQARRTLFAIGMLHDDLGQCAEAMTAFREANSSKAGDFDIHLTARTVATVCSTFSAERLPDLPRAQTSDGSRPVFIGGLPRSGTTLVEQILCSHPEIGAAGETTLMPRLLNLAITQSDTDAGYPGAIPAMDPSLVDEVGRVGRAELTTAAGGRPIITEKSTNNTTFAGPISMFFPDARLIVCERDLVDTGLSIFQHEFAGHFPWAYDLDTIGRYARVHEHIVNHWRSVEPLPILTIRYEDMVNDTEATIRRLLEFVGVAWDDRCLAFHQTDRRVQTASREQVRRPIYTSATGKAARYDGMLDDLQTALAAPLPSILQS